MCVPNPRPKKVHSSVSLSKCIGQTFCHVCLLVIITLSFVKCQAEIPPSSFTTQPESGSIQAIGSNKVLQCRSSSEPSPEYRWLKNDEYMTNASYNGYTFKLENISEDDDATYRCEARNKLGSILSAPAIVQVAYFGQFVDSGRTLPISVDEGNAIVIPLPNIDSFPAPTLDWARNSVPLNVNGGQKYQITLNGSLVLLDSSIDNNKQYSISATNGISGDTEVGPSFSLTVNAIQQFAPRIAPTLVIGPSDQTVRDVVGSLGVFECIVNARPVDELVTTWYKVVDGASTPITNGDKYLLSAYNNRKLTIRNIDQADAGEYQCVTTLTGFPDTVTASAFLTVNVSPTFAIQFPSELSRDFGQTVTMTCQANGIPDPTIHWLYNSQEIGTQLNSSSYTVYDNGSLSVTKLDLEHAGMYQCYLRNAAGETSKSTWLTVNSSPPEFLTRPSNVTIVAGGDARFPCDTRGAPKPVVTWTKTNDTGVTNVTTSGKIQILDRGELLIVSGEPKDKGLYTCSATNIKGTISAFASLYVYARTKIDRPPQDQNIIKGATATFPCGVSHDPSIVVTWQWSHRSSHSTSESEIIVTDADRTVYPDGTLGIQKIKNTDIGSYTCLVTSMGGNDSRTITLSVIELPKPPIIQSVILDPDDVRGVIVTWTPEYDGNTPILKYSIQYHEVIYGEDEITEDLWTTYDAEIPVARRQAAVGGLRPARFYQFRMFAFNLVGQGLPSDPNPDPALEMPQQPPSSPPKGFFGRPESNSSIHLGWQAPDKGSWNGDLVGYIIQYKENLYPNVTFQRENVTNLSLSPRYVLRNLAFFTKYELQIAAYNAKGIGVFSNVIRTSTLEGHPTAPPENLSVRAVNSTSVFATWTPPDPQFINGINIGYKVLGRRSTVQQNEFSVIVPQDQSNPTGNQTTYLLNLLKYTEYHITVVCYTSQGEGPTAKYVTVTTQEDVPSMVGSLTFTEVRDKSLKVTWTPPTEINGILTGYTLSYWKKNDTSTKKNVQLSPTNLTYSINNLIPMTKYSINVHASTAIGAGPVRSADIESGVPPEYPEPPFNLGVSNIQARSVLLQFLPGFDGKTTITLWIVEGREGKDATVYKTIDEKSDPDARAIQVENLNPYTYYTLRIIAVNIKGASNASMPSRMFQTLQDAPGVPPGNVTVRALNATALRVSWTPLSINDWNGEPRGYKIYYKMHEDTDFAVIDLDNGMNMDSAILAGLEEWMKYDVKMLAYNDVGDSVFSQIKTERTREAVPNTGPANVSALAISSTSINVTWGEVPKLKQNGMIQGFKVQYRSQEAGIGPQLQDVSGNTSRSVIIHNLRKYIYYEIQVLAYTRMGDGVLSDNEVRVQTMDDVPGPPVIIWFPQVSQTLATIEWQAPTEPNGIITGYMVSYKLNGDISSDYQNSTDLDENIKNFTVGNLQSMAHYEFRVVAKTNHGWGEMASVLVFTMTNRNPPDSPSHLSIQTSLIQARSVTINWKNEFNGYGPLRNFTVQYKTKNQFWDSVLETINPDVTTYSVKGLRPNTHYVFRVAATNDIGNSPFSEQSEEVKTLEDKPEGAPRFVKVEPLTRTSVNVMWEQPLPSSWNGALQGYILMYRQAENNNFMEETIDVLETSKTLYNLTKFVNYEFLLKAYNSVGKGPTSTPVVVFVGEAAPTAPPTNIVTMATNSTEISLSWRPPPLDTQNGDLSGYKISYWLSSEAESGAKQIIVREESALLSDLHIYSEYAITVQATNLAGEGPKSDIKTQKTLEGLPGAPAEMSFWNITYVSLDVHWQPPVQPNGRIANYELSYLEVNSPNGGTKLVKFNVSGGLTSLTIKDLTEGFMYKFSVSARTSIGPGQSIEGTVTTGPQPGSPGQPQQPVLLVNNENQMLLLTWADGPLAVKPIYGHIIQSKTKDSTRWETIVEISGQQTEADISLLKLNPDNEYQFRVIALNSIGISHFSEPSVMFRTPAPAIEEPETPFHYEWWFLVIVALTGLIIILIVVSLLCLVSRRSKSKQKKAGTSTSTSNLTPAAEPEEGGFGNFEMPTRQSTHSRRQKPKYAGISNNIYARTPPRPSPASVAYSDDDAASAVKPPLPDDDDDDDDSDCTQKPSDIGESSTEPSDCESDDSIDPPLPPPPPPASPPPPPFTSAVNRNEYHNNHEPANNSWQHQNNQSFNAYQYTDSEAESSHYGYSLNGGQIMLNNTAGSRAPLPGFSSFV